MSRFKVGQSVSHNQYPKAIGTIVSVTNKEVVAKFFRSSFFYDKDVADEILTILPRWHFAVSPTKHKTCVYILPGLFGSVERETDILIISVGVKYLDFVGVLKFWRC